jgi:hypothetical protein
MLGKLAVKITLKEKSCLTDEDFNPVNRNLMLFPWNRGHQIKTSFKNICFVGWAPISYEC